MKCLYCGKELAIFKRLSGSEFCSDGHRKQYQQEYNQLALSRLLHSQPVGHKTVAREQTALVPKEGEQPKRSEQPRTDPRTIPVTGTTATRHAPATIAPNGIPRKFPTPPPPAAIRMPAVSNAPAAPAAAAPKEPAARVAPAAPVAPAARIAPVSPQAPAPVAPPPPPEARPPAPMAGMLDFKPTLRLGATATLTVAAVELLEETRKPEHPVVQGEHSDFRLKNAENIPLEFGFVEPQAGTITTESRPEARDFARPVPRIEMSYAILIPAFGPLKEPLPVEMATRISEPASVWIFGGLPYTGTTLVERGPLVEFTLHPAGLEALADASTAALRDAVSAHAHEPAHQDAPVIDEGSQQHSSTADEYEHIAAEANVADATADKATEAEPSPADSLQPPPMAPETPTRSNANRVVDWDNLEAPTLVTRPMLIVPRAAAAGKAKPVQVFQATLASASKVEIPRYDVLPLRPVIFVASASETKGSTPSTAAAEHSKKVPSEPRHEQAAAVITPKSPAAKVEAPASVTARKSPTPAGASAKAPQPQGKTTDPDTPGKHKTADAVSAPKVTLSAGSIVPKPVDPRLSGGAKTGTAEQAKITAPAPKPAGSMFGKSELGLPKLHVGASRMPSRKVMFAAGGVAALLAIVLVIFSMRGPSAPNAVAAPSPLKSTTIGVGPDWIENFSPDPGHPRTISILRSTTGYKDYRIEMEAQIDTKALGWIFRAVDSNNFYVGKIEVDRDGANLNPFLVHYAVINGVPEAGKRMPLPFTATPSTVYRVHFEATGNRFTAYVQDRKADTWTDGRLTSGGAGLYSDSGERAILQSGFDVTPTGKTN